MRLAHHPASLRMRALRPLWESSFATADAAAVTPPATIGDLAGVRVCECSTVVVPGTTGIPVFVPRVMALFGIASTGP